MVEFGFVGAFQSRVSGLWWKRGSMGGWKCGDRRFYSSGRLDRMKKGGWGLFLGGGSIVAGGIVLTYMLFYEDAGLDMVHSESAAGTVADVLTWKPASRLSMVSNLRQSSAENPFDLLIIGGGATGAGCALEASTRGLRVALVEREDFSSGTSSKSTKLVHGGVRYLEKAFKEFDYEQYKLVCEALAERSTFLKIAPHLSEPLPILLPIYKWWMVPYFWFGSKTYDLLAGRQGLSSSYFMSKTKVMETFPMLKSESLMGAMVYYDGQHNDSRTNVTLALTSAYHGASVLNHAEVTGLIKDGGGKTVGANVMDVISGESFPIFAKGVVNATGPYCDSIRRMDDPSTKEIVSPSSGVHVVLPDYYCPRNMGMLDPATSDGRIVFVLPWQGSTIAGTTDTPSGLSYDPNPSEKDIQFILKEVSNFLDPNIQVRREDVLSAWCGIRPLIQDPKTSGSTQALVRSHLIAESSSGLLTISGGKWTTYRNMAQETIEEAIRCFKLRPSGPSVTAKTLLLGAHGYKKTGYFDLIQKFGMDSSIAKHLCSNYGDRASLVAELAVADVSSGNNRWPIEFGRLVPDYPFLEAEVRYAIRYEYAQTAIDVLGRRTRLAFLNSRAALEAIPKIVSIMAKESEWSSARSDAETKAAVRFLTSMGLEP